MMNMKKGKAAAVGVVICFVAVIAFVGYTTFSRYERKLDTEQGEETPTESANTEQIQAEIPKVEEVPEIVYEEPVVEAPKEVVQETPNQEFTSEDTLIWPVSGDVILNYSMDQTVHFLTLDQYKYNPALIIGGEVGEEVLAAADGTVTNIEVHAETGTTLTVDIGSGYEVVYGQLKEVMVEKGAKVNQGDWIGYLSEPTKYYSVEGCNLYFQLLKDGQPINPLEYMEA